MSNEEEEEEESKGEEEEEEEEGGMGDVGKHIPSIKLTLAKIATRKYGSRVRASTKAAVLTFPELSVLWTGTRSCHFPQQEQMPSSLPGLQLVQLLVLATLLLPLKAFVPYRPLWHGPLQQQKQQGSGRSSLGLPEGVVSASLEPSTTSRQDTVRERLAQEWELDCYSRPVIGEDGKKLWELMVCDSLGEFRAVEAMPSNMVNSRELRKLVEKIIEDAPVKPRVIRFFRNAMFNMVSLSLKDLKVRVVPSRSTNALFSWIDEREKEVYSKMPGYDSQMRDSNDVFGLREPEIMPDGLMGDKYAFMCLPASHFLDGEVNYDNSGIARLFALDKSIPRDKQVQGIVIYSPRAKSIAAWLASMELCFIKANFSKRFMVLEVGIDTQYLMATLNDVRRVEAQIFEKGKEELGGVHFLALQTDENSDGVEGFFLLRERKR